MSLALTGCGIYNKYAINTELFVSVDQMSEIMKNVLKAIQEDIENASDKRKSEK